VLKVRFGFERRSRGSAQTSKHIVAERREEITAYTIHRDHTI
jgi:hypothetical protein